jgi:hypothetical protein
MKHFVKLLLLTCLSTPVFAQQETAVRATISTFFTGMNKSDTTLVRSTLLPGARLQTVLNKEGKVSIQEGDFGRFMTSIGKAKPGSLDERLGNYTVHVDGDLATAFTPYEFWYNGQQSHCGSNAFTLVRVDGDWKVQAIIDTRRKCQ